MRDLAVLAGEGRLPSTGRDEVDQAGLGATDHGFASEPRLLVREKHTIMADDDYNGAA